MNGSSKLKYPISLKALVINLAYNKCIQACSGPPTYLSTGSILSTFSLSNAILSFLLSTYLIWYQEEQTNVSKVSHSLLAGLPQQGQVVLTNSSHLASGDLPSGANSTLYGNSTGRSFSGTGTAPQSSQ